MKKGFLIFAFFLTTVLSSCGVATRYSSSVYDDAIYYREPREDRTLAEAKQYLQNYEYERDVYALNKGESYEQRLNKFKGTSNHTTIINVNINDSWCNPWWGCAYGWYSPWQYNNFVCWNNHTIRWNMYWNWGWHWNWDPYWGWSWGGRWIDPWYGPGIHPWYPVYPVYPVYTRNVVYGRRASDLPGNNTGLRVSNGTYGFRSGSSYSQTRDNTGNGRNSFGGSTGYYNGADYSNVREGSGSVTNRQRTGEGGYTSSGQSVRGGSGESMQNRTSSRGQAVRGNYTGSDGMQNRASGTVNSNNRDRNSNIRQGDGRNGSDRGSLINNQATSVRGGTSAGNAVRGGVSSTPARTSAPVGGAVRGGSIGGGFGGGSMGGGSMGGGGVRGGGGGIR